MAEYYEHDLYHVMDLSHIGKGATQEEIRDAYMRLCKKHHPDKGGSTEAFQVLNQAYSVLGDAKTKACYDRARVMRDIHASEARGMGMPTEEQPDWIRSRMRGRAATKGIGACLGVLGIATIANLWSGGVFGALGYAASNFLTCTVFINLCCHIGKLSMGYTLIQVPFLLPVLIVATTTGVVLAMDQLCEDPLTSHHFLAGAAAGFAEGVGKAAAAPLLLCNVLDKLGAPLANYLNPGLECSRTACDMGSASRPRYVYYCKTCKEWLCSHCAYHCHKGHRVGRAVNSSDIGQTDCNCGIPACANRHREPIAALLPASGQDGVAEGEWVKIDYSRESTSRPEIDRDYVMIGDGL